jgi:hypothetical protein
MTLNLAFYAKKGILYNDMSSAVERAAIAAERILNTPAAADVVPNTGLGDGRATEDYARAGDPEGPAVPGQPDSDAERVADDSDHRANLPPPRGEADPSADHGDVQRVAPPAPEQAAGVGGAALALDRREDELASSDQRNVEADRREDPGVEDAAPEAAVVDGDAALLESAHAEPVVEATAPQLGVEAESAADPEQAHATETADRAAEGPDAATEPSPDEGTLDGFGDFDAFSAFEGFDDQPAAHTRIADGPAVVLVDSRRTDELSPATPDRTAEAADNDAANRAPTEATPAIADAVPAAGELPYDTEQAPAQEADVLGNPAPAAEVVSWTGYPGSPNAPAEVRDAYAARIDSLNRPFRSAAVNTASLAGHASRALLEGLKHAPETALSGIKGLPEAMVGAFLGFRTWYQAQAEVRIGKMEQDPRTVMMKLIYTHASRQLDSGIEKQDRAHQKIHKSPLPQNARKKGASPTGTGVPKNASAPTKPGVNTGGTSGEVSPAQQRGRDLLNQGGGHDRQWPGRR